MKRFSENRTIAWVVFAVCILFSLSFSSERALTNLRRDNERIFYQGTSQSMGQCIDKHLTTRATSAYNVASVAANYPEINQTLVQEAKDAATQLQDASDIAAKNTLNTALNRAVEDLYTAVENTQLSKADKDYAYGQYKEFKGAGDMIGRDEYNKYADEFNAELDYFPASQLAKITGVQPLPRFN